MGGNPNHAHNNRPRLGNIVNRVFESAGPDGKVRGTPQQIIDKYQALARDAQLTGDRVAAESFLQHAEHYSRMLGEAQPQGELRQPFEREDGFRDEGFRDEGRREDAPRAENQPDQPRPRGEGQPAQSRPRDEGRPQHQPQRRPEPQPKPVIASSLTTIDPEDDDDLGGLIDTPESVAAAAVRRDDPEPEPAAVVNGAANGAGHATQAIVEALPPEEAPRPAPKRGRPRRKAPRPEGEQADTAPAE